MTYHSQTNGLRTFQLDHCRHIIDVRRPRTQDMGYDTTLRDICQKHGRTRDVRLHPFRLLRGREATTTLDIMYHTSTEMTTTALTLLQALNEPRRHINSRDSQRGRNSASAPADSTYNAVTPSSAPASRRVFVRPFTVGI